MNLIDDVLAVLADPDSDLFDALYAADTAASHLTRARARLDGSLGAKKVLKRAEEAVESAYQLVPALDEPFRGLFDVLLGAYNALAAYRAAAGDESLEERTHPVEGGSGTYECAAGELEYAEHVARKVLAEALAESRAVMAA